MCDPTRGMPATTELMGIATYKGAKGEARVAHAAAELPLALFCRAVPPVRLQVPPLTLETNMMPPPLSTLYEDVLAQEEVSRSDMHAIGEHASNLITLRYRNGADVQVLASKSSGRYRVQAASLEARALAAIDLRRRLARHFATTQGTPAPKGKADGGGEGDGESAG